MYIYIYIYIYINFKAINNALDSKMVLKTHLFIKNISLSLQKLRQYNKSLTKHQTKINTAIITNQLKLQKNENFKILKSIVIVKNILKIAYKNIYVQKQPSRGVLPESRCTNTKQTHRRTTAQKRDLNKAALQLY